MDAVVIAGGIPQPQDPLYRYSQGNAKALIEIAGKPMVQWVLDALADAQTVDRIVIIGVTDKSGLSCRKPLVHVSSEGRMLANIQAGTAKVRELNPRAEFVLFVTSDIPALTGPMVDWVVSTALQTQHDIYYTVIARQTMEERFPTAKRTFVQLKDLQACGGDMHVARAAVVDKNSAFWDKLIESRKSPAAQASLLGFDIVFRFLLRQLTAEDIIRRVAERLGLKGRALISPFAEIGMDVDKPHQFEMMRAHLARSLRAQRSTPPRKSKTPAKRRAAKRRPSRAVKSASVRRRKVRARPAGARRGSGKK